MNGGDYGKVVFWNDAGGYGFIRPDRAERDVFFHVSELNGQEIRIGDRVSYETGVDRRPGRNPQTCAKSVRIVGGDQ